MENLNKVSKRWTKHLAWIALGYILACLSGFLLYLLIDLIVGGRLKVELRSLISLLTNLLPVILIAAMPGFFVLRLVLAALQRHDLPSFIFMGVVVAASASTILWVPDPIIIIRNTILLVVNVPLGHNLDLFVVGSFAGTIYWSVERYGSGATGQKPLSAS